MKAVVLALAAALGLAAGAGAEEPACVPRTLERGGAPFLEVCGAGVFLSAAPVACGGGEAPCDPVTALAPGPREGGANRHVDARVAGGEDARRLCRERFGGRLPTPAERERARALGFVTVQVREEPGEFARLRLDEQPEWVADGERLLRTPSDGVRPRAAGETLLGCVAEPALPRARAVPLGSVCDERPAEANVRSPDCALASPSGARFELGCDPAHAVRSAAPPDGAAVRCIVSP